MWYARWLTRPLYAALPRPYVHVLFGARQTGKSTLIRALIPDPDLWIDLSDPAERSQYLAEPGSFVEVCRALPLRRRPYRIVVDEAQAVPAIFDGVQHLYDRERERFRFVLSGSSARKLRVTGANLLPGRSLLHHLFPLTLAERPASGVPEPPPPVRHRLPSLSFGSGARRAGALAAPAFPAASLLERLTYGELPGIVLAPIGERQRLLRSYAYVYLEEELRREALIKEWPTFARFLRLAALEPGQLVNYSKIAQQAGVSGPTVKSHYQLLEDMFIGFHLPAFSGSARKHVLSTPRFYFFDVGVRHVAAGLTASRDTVLANPGPIFEQWVGIELWKRTRYLGRGSLSYLRTKAGVEIDFVVNAGPKTSVPVEVKWTEHPTRHDARHLESFLDEQGRRAPVGYLVCRCERPRQITERVVALPWWAL